MSMEVPLAVQEPSRLRRAGTGPLPSPKSTRVSADDAASSSTILANDCATGFVNGPNVAGPHGAAALMTTFHPPATLTSLHTGADSVASAFPSILPAKRIGGRMARLPG